jgi:hypothetical protein
MTEERFVCTKEKPWKPEYGKRAIHPDAKEVGSQRDGWPAGDEQDYECPHCGLRFTVELPQ